MYLVTGVSGLLGLSLARYLTGRGVPVAGTSAQHRVRMEGLDYHACDLLDVPAVQSLFRQVQPRVLVHCAAATNVDWCEQNPEAAFALNSGVCRMLADVANENGTRFVFISTDSVFNGSRGNYVELDDPDPLNVYARSKLAGEEIVTTRAQRGTILRTNMFGWNGQPKNSLAEWVLKELQAGKGINGFTDVIFSPLLTTDLAAIIYRVAESGLDGIYHAGAADACSKFDFATRLAVRSGLDPGLIRPQNLQPAPQSARRPLNTSLCSARLEQALGERFPRIDDGLDRFIAEGRNKWAQALEKHIL